MTRMPGRPGRAYVVRWGSQTLAVRTLADGRVLVQPLLPRSLVAPARPALERQDRLPCQGCRELFPALDMWIDAEDPRRGFCDRCYYARRRERGRDGG